MKKILLTSFLLTLSSASFAWEKVSCAFTSPEGTAACLMDLNLVKRNFGIIHNSAPCIGLEERSLMALSKANKDPVVPPLGPEFAKEGAKCGPFITNKGDGKASYGEYGKIVAKYLQEKGDNNILFSNELPGMIEMPEICPRWKKLNRKQKEYFWVYAFAAISYDESKCNPAAKNPKGSNGIAIGLTQMDQQVSKRSWRGPDCKVADIAPPANNLRCALNIMEELLKGPKGEYKGTGHIYNTGRNTSYWQKLKGPNGGQIGRLMKTNPLCH